MSFLSFTQGLGKLITYWHIFIGVIFIVAMLAGMFFVYTSKKWPPECQKDGKPPQGSSTCADPKSKIIMIMAGLAIFACLILYLNIHFRNNKTFQTIVGGGTEAGAAIDLAKSFS